MRGDIRKLVKPNVRSLRAYAAKDVPCRVKLDANESPYGFPLIEGIETNRYPDPEARALRAALARPLKVAPANVLVGNGSDEIISYLIMTFGGPVLSLTPTFVMYDIIARSLGERSLSIPLDPAFDIDLRATLDCIRREKPRVVFIATPNNPTGNRPSDGRVERVLRAARGSVVVVDEAYLPFSRALGYCGRLSEFPNLLVLRTLSKIGLAALRVGYLVGAEPALAEVGKVRLPFNVSTLSQEFAVRALRDRAALRRSIRAVVAERTRLARALNKLPGLTVHPSEANFIMVGVPDAPSVHAALLARGVLVRDLDGAGIVPGALRVSVGTPAENDAFLAALGEALSKRRLGT